MMNKLLNAVWNILYPIFSTLLLLFATLLAAHYLVQIFPYIDKLYRGEMDALYKQLALTKKYWPSYYMVRMCIYLMFFLTGILTVVFFIIKFLLKLVGKAPRNIQYALLTGSFFFLLLVGIQVALSYKYGTYRGPGGTILFYGEMQKLQSEQIHAADSVGMNYFIQGSRFINKSMHINKDGFIATFDYTPHFCDSVRKSGKKIVFVVGDSFAEGVTDKEYSTVFTERIRNADTSIILLNFGVGGLDPLNYFLIISKYVPLLKPDLVVVAFCWNDIMVEDRIATPYIPLHYQTNIGYLSSNIPYSISGKENAILPTIDSAYNYYKRWFFIDPKESGWAWLCSKSPIIASIKCKKIHQYINPNYEKNYASISYRYIKKMDSVCIANDARMSIAFIPDIHRVDTLQTIERNRTAYANAFHEYVYKVHFIENTITRTDYISEANQHFTANGNEKYAVFLKNVIHQELDSK
ncbi:MAG: SGNH/GDSL hydrolase family protein [Bacteroidetes bacterium]|nr:SGNH/GDSL hydrolase family protein [Bacteroidota bacterium]